MLSSLLRPRKARPRRDRSPFSSPFNGDEASPLFGRRHSNEERRRPAGRFYRDDDSSDGDSDSDDVKADSDNDSEAGGEDEDDLPEASPLLPIFSAAHLDSLPVYNLTHAIRLVIVPRCETTLTWDQLRSPQISQFLVKPIQQQIHLSHFSRATLYALLANCLQFNKEAYSNPGNRGTSQTRALVCELLAIRLLKEFTSRELIDALSYDFDPLQGMSPPGAEPAIPAPNWNTQQRRRSQPRVARISTLEVAIRAQSKRFLAHPLVVQHLEAIWAGTIVFHSAADNMHRPPTRDVPNQTRGYGTVNSAAAALQASPDKLQPAKQRQHQESMSVQIRRSVTIYDPRNASLFKLSRLRVPRYRQFLSTCSLAILLMLYLAVLTARCQSITALEVIFWLWSAGFMLDEIVGFNEQGLSLYIMSFWNIFDLGILFLLVIYYGLRLYGILMPDDVQGKYSDMAYDVLAACAVFLFPRLFSVLDHYRYFSQLLIAFRLMAVDLCAIFVLIMISCSGFFVAFTLSSGNDYDARGVAYALFQILLGFTPAAWNTWDSQNFLGKAILTVFLFVCHFLVVTILITVLTNSFMAIVANANEEHQFLFAVNAISMVKSDALFSYIAPTNVIAWLLTPLRYVVSFRQYVRLNRLVIKITHVHILLAIYTYERIVLRAMAFEPMDLVEERGRSREAVQSPQQPGMNVGTLFSPASRLRQGSRAGFQKDRALEEVFSRPFKDSMKLRSSQLRTPARRNPSNLVATWMQGIASEGAADSPMEQDRSEVDRLEIRRPSGPAPSKLRSSLRGKGRIVTDTTRSATSDPEDFAVSSQGPRPRRLGEADLPSFDIGEVVEQPGAEGDDEPMTTDVDDHVSQPSGAAGSHRTERGGGHDGAEEGDYFRKDAPQRVSVKTSLLSSSLAPTLVVPPVVVPPELRGASKSSKHSTRPSPPRQEAHTSRGHARNVSTATVLFKPVVSTDDSSSSPPKRPSAGTKSGKNSGANTPMGKSPARKSPRRPLGQVSKARPIMPPRTQFQSTPNLAGLVAPEKGRVGGARPASMAFDLASDLGDNMPVQGDSNFLAGVPSSFAAQMAFATGHMRAPPPTPTSRDESSRMMGRLMLTRMNTLEESFREMIGEVRQMRGDEKRKREDVGGAGPSGGIEERKLSRKSGGGGGGASASASGKRAVSQKVDGAGALDEVSE
ncbi:MAG: hypothetical protein M1825_003169 [Sarcosagium campestre]|nr:MAG: hypothetical protein M1825_003169 [Sarcosagium campestre]